jgi:hypothetical protein
MPVRLLLLAPDFYGIENEIATRLEKLGFDVSYLENKVLTFDYHGQKASLRLLRRIYYFFFKPDVRYIRKFFCENENPRFDLLFAINCHCVNSSLFKILRKFNPAVRSVVFLWDSLSSYSWEKEVRLFDKSFTYDITDSEKYGISYMPNFYIKPNQIFTGLYHHKVFFAGKFNLKRFNEIDELNKIFQNQEVDSYLKLLAGTKKSFHNSFLYRIIKALPSNTSKLDYVANYEAIEKIIIRDYIIYDSIEFIEVQEHLSGSNVVLDIEYSEQFGYSHRLIEALSQGKKILTTNSSIGRENFFNDKQIKIIDTNKIAIDIEWLKREEVYEIPNCISDLELTPWLKSLLQDEISEKAA